MTTTNEKTTVLPGTLDKKGTPFDPARHVPRMHPKTGRWLPRSPGRGHKGQARLPGVDSPAPAPAAPPAAATPPPPAPTLPETVAAPAETVPDAAPTPAPAANGSAPSFADIERAAGTPPAEAAEKTAERAADAQAVVVDQAEQQADTLWRALYSVFGAVTGAPEETTRTGAAHANNRAVLAAWMVESGIKIKGVWGLVITVISYFAETGTKPKTRSWLAQVSDYFGKKKPAPLAMPAAAAPPPAAPAAKPSAPAATPPRAFSLGE